MSDIKKAEGQAAKSINLADTVCFKIDYPAEGVRKGEHGVVVGFNGHPVDSYDVEIGRGFPVTVGATQVELAWSASSKPTIMPKPNSQHPTVPPMKLSAALKK